MRAVAYKLALAPERAAESTTTSMRKLAEEIPATRNTVTNGLSVTPAFCHGITPTSTAIAPTYTKLSVRKAFRVARATSVRDLASPEEMATISMPRKLYSPKEMAMSEAVQPRGANPPWATYSGCTLPPKRNAAPIRMNTKMVTTLISANQYSKVP